MKNLIFATIAGAILFSGTSFASESMAKVTS
jgi:hypothetical protein